MPKPLTRPAVQVLMLVAVTAVLLLPNLGGPGLWDEDEGLNAECTREMAEACTWIVPTFNWDLRTAKPVLLYWLMRGSYAAFGVNEFAARLPSAAMTLLTVLLVYDLGRRMFDSATGLLAGIAVVSMLQMAALGHWAATDATLIGCVTLYFWGFWRGTANGGRWWHLPCGVAAALATLAKGPAAGLVLPAAAVVGWFIWHRDWRRLLDWRFAFGVVAFVLVAGPWYGLVASETRGEWPRAFFLDEHFGRASEARESHRGIPVLYEFAALCVSAAPWSAFLAVTVWKSAATAFKRVEVGGDDGERRAVRLLLLWAGAVFLACAAAATKLPHYVAPLLPPLAILTARTLLTWATRGADWPWWVAPGGIAVVALIGLAVSALLLVGGLVPLRVGEGEPRVPFPGLHWCAWIGLLPLAGAVGMARAARRDLRGAFVAWFAASAVAFIGCLAAYVPGVVDRQKAVKALVEQSGARQLDREVRVMALDYAQPSATFYVGRRVDRFTVNRPGDAAAVADWLSFPPDKLPVFVFVPEGTWNAELEPLVKSPHRMAAKHYDFYRGCDIVVVTNTISN